MSAGLLWWKLARLHGGLKVLYAILGIAIALVALLSKLSGVHDLAILQILLFVLALDCYQLPIFRTPLPLLLTLPIPTRSIFWSTLCADALTGFLPALLLASYFSWMADLDAVRLCLAVGALMIAVRGALWLGWPKSLIVSRKTAILAIVLQNAVVCLWLAHAPSWNVVAAVFLFSALVCGLTPLRLPLSFLHRELDVLTNPNTTQTDVRLLRTWRQILVPWRSMFILLPALAILPRWPWQAILLAGIYSQVRTPQLLVLTLPLSQSRLMYIRLISAVTVVGCLSSVNLLGRLLHTPATESLPSALFAIATGLLLIVSAHLVTWHRLRNWPRTLLVLAMFMLLVATFALSFTPLGTGVIFHSIRTETFGQLTLGLLLVTLLLVLLLQLLIRESDYYGSNAAIRDNLAKPAS